MHKLAKFFKNSGVGTPFIVMLGPQELLLENGRVNFKCPFSLSSFTFSLTFVKSPKMGLMYFLIVPICRK